MGFKKYVKEGITEANLLLRRAVNLLDILVEDRARESKTSEDVAYDLVKTVMRRHGLLLDEMCEPTKDQIVDALDEALEVSQDRAKVFEEIGHLKKAVARHSFDGQPLIALDGMRPYDAIVFATTYLNAQADRIDKGDAQDG